MCCRLRSVLEHCCDNMVAWLVILGLACKAPGLALIYSPDLYSTGTPGVSPVLCLCPTSLLEAYSSQDVSLMIPNGPSRSRSNSIALVTSTLIQLEVFPPSSVLQNRFVFLTAHIHVFFLIQLAIFASHFL